MAKSHFYTFLFFALPLLYFLSLPITIGDLSGWVAHGMYFLRTGSLIRHDIYSVLPTIPLVYPAGLPLVYAVINAAGGLLLVSLFHKAALLALLFIVYRSSVGRMKNPYSPKNLLLVLFALSGFGIYFLDRPALVALIPLVLSYLVIEGDEKHGVKFYLKLAGLMVIWVNIHGSWVLLPVMLGWKLLLDFKREELLPNFCGGLVLLGATLLNPFGYEVWPYILQTAELSKLRRIDEWNVTNLHDFFPQGYIFFASALVFLIVVFKMRPGRSVKRMFSSPIFILLIMGFTAMRNVGLFNLVMLPFFYRYGFLSEAPPAPERKKLLNALIAAAVALLTVAEIPYLRPYTRDFLPAHKAEVFDETLPVHFAEYIRHSGSRAPILNDWGYGSYLMYCAEMYGMPNKILVDFRGIIYLQPDFLEYQKIINGDDSWAAFAEKYGFGFILADRKYHGVLIGKVKASGAWNEVLADENTVLFERKK